MVKILYGKGGIEFDETRYGASIIESRIGELKAGDDGRSRLCHLKLRKHNSLVFV